MSQPEHSFSDTLIDSLNHPQASIIRELLTRDGRHTQKKIIIDDEENIIQAIKAGIKLESVYFSGEIEAYPIIQSPLLKGVPIKEIAKRTAKKLFQQDRFSRVFAIAHLPSSLGIDQIASIKQDCIVLEDLSIAGNIGSIIRSSLALNAGAIILLNMDPLDLYDRRLIRSSRGYLFNLPIITVETQSFIEYCRQNDECLALLSIKADTSIEQLKQYPSRTLLTFGSEKQGNSNIIEENATLKFKIPINPIVESLNVSAAAAIALSMRLTFNQELK